VNRNNAYMWYAASTIRIWGRFASRAECLATHGGGCAAVAECLGWDWSALPDACAQGCSGSVFTGCAEGIVHVDCSKLGLSCDPNAICSEAPMTSCDRNAFTSTCDGTMPVTCDDKVVFRGPDCGPLGLDCANGACVGKGPACTGGSLLNGGQIFYDGVACDGDVLVTCVGGREHRLSCPGIAPGFSCHTRGADSFCGLAAECTPAEPGSGSGSRGTCSGTTLEFCNAGRTERIDCRSLGFERCDTTTAYGCLPTFLRP